MSGEAKTEGKTTESSSFGANNLVFSYSQSVSKTHSFSQSSKFESKKESNSKTESTSFEAGAVCSEFEASFIPGVDHELSPEFQNALDNLPVP